MGWKARKDKLQSDQPDVEDGESSPVIEQEMNIESDAASISRLAAVAQAENDDNGFGFDLDAFRTDSSRTSLDPSAFPWFANKEAKTDSAQAPLGFAPHNGGPPVRGQISSAAVPTGPRAPQPDFPAPRFEAAPAFDTRPAAPPPQAPFESPKPAFGAFTDDDGRFSVSDPSTSTPRFELSPEPSADVFTPGRAPTNGKTPGNYEEPTFAPAPETVPQSPPLPTWNPADYRDTSQPSPAAFTEQPAWSQPVANEFDAAPNYGHQSNGATAPPPAFAEPPSTTWSEPPSAETEASGPFGKALLEPSGRFTVPGKWDQEEDSVSNRPFAPEEPPAQWEEPAPQAFQPVQQYAQPAQPSDPQPPFAPNAQQSAAGIRPQSGPTSQSTPYQSLAGSNPYGYAPPATPPPAPPSPALNPAVSEGQNINSFSRESVAPGLVSGEGEFSIPKVAPFIVAGAGASAPEEIAASTDHYLIIRMRNLAASHKLVKDVTTIGRPDSITQNYPDVEIELDDGVSRKHAEIRRKGVEFFVVDVGSTNGTLHNGDLLDVNREMKLAHGDRIRVGERTEIVFE